MNKVRKQSRRRYASASEWPAWTDFVRYFPTDADQAEVAALNSTWDDSDGPDSTDPIWDEWAAEAITRDQIERGVRMF